MYVYSYLMDKMAISPKGESKGADISIIMVLPFVPKSEVIGISVHFVVVVVVVWSYSIGS